MNDKKNEEQPIVQIEVKEYERLKKKEKNRMKRERDEKLLEEMLEDLDDDTYAIMKKLK